ncbi:Tissue inhibitor of metalloproteinase [compost metagenome]
MKRILLLLITLFSILIKTYCCSCIGIADFNTSIKKADVVFSARIISEERFLAYEPDESELFFSKNAGLRIRYKVEVEEIYKGRKGKFKKVMYLVTGLGDGDCGIKLIENQSYIIYGIYKNQFNNYTPKVHTFIYTDICTRTAIFNVNDKEEIKRIIRRW